MLRLSKPFSTFAHTPNLRASMGQAAPDDEPPDPVEGVPPELGEPPPGVPLPGYGVLGLGLGLGFGFGLPLPHSPQAETRVKKRRLRTRKRTRDLENVDAILDLY